MFNRLPELKEYAKGLKLLYVEDNNEARKFTGELLNRFFNSIDSAKNGREGLELYTQNRYDLVITDINMPEMNGIEMGKKIREINPEQKIIAISAHNESDILIELVKAGFNSFVIKPIEANELFKCLYPIVRDAYTQKLNEELVIQLGKEREKLKRQVKELLSLSRTVETKHQQIQQLMDESEKEKEKESMVSEYFKPDDNTQNDSVLFLSDHRDDLIDIFNEISDLLGCYMEEYDTTSIAKISAHLTRSVSILLYYTPYADILADSLSNLTIALKEHENEFKAVCENSPNDILRLFDAVSSDIERYVDRFSKESLAMHNVHHIHKPTALSILQIIQCIAPQDDECGEIEFF